MSWLTQLFSDSSNNLSGNLGKWWDNGVSHSFNYYPVSRGEDGNGWSMVEVVMERLNQSYTAENSTFQVFGELGANRTRIGFDAAICVEEVKGYIVDTYNYVSNHSLEAWVN